MEIPGKAFLKNLFAPKEKHIVGTPIASSPPLAEVPPLPTPNPPDMMAINQANQGVAKPNPEAVEGMYNAAAAGKPETMGMMATDAGVPVPDNLKTVADNQQAGLNPPPAAPDQKTA